MKNIFGDEVVEQTPLVNSFGDPVDSSPPPLTVAQRELEAGLLGGTGQPMSRQEAATLARQRFVQRAAMEGNGQRFKIVNPGTLQEALQAETTNQDFKAPSHLDVFGQSFKPLVPLVGAGDEFNAGMQSGKQLAGNGLIGQRIGALLGTARAANTIFNPVAGLANEVPVVAQASGAGLGGGNIESALRALGERAPITSIATIPQANTGISALDTALNTGVNIGNAAVDQPLLISGLTPEALGVQGRAVRNFPSNIASLAADVPKLSPLNIAKGVAEVVAPKTAANFSENRAPASLSQIAESTLDFTPEQVAEHLPTAVARVRQVTGKEVPNTAREGISALDKAENEIYSQRQEINYAADKRGLSINGNQALDSARTALDEIKTITNAEKDRILKKAEELYSGERPPTDGQLVQQQLNEKLKGFYSSEDPVATAQQKVDLAIRDSYANQMNEISQIMTGRAETPYSDIGNIIETRNALRRKLEQIEGSEADKKSGIGKGPSRIPTTKTGVATKVTNSVLTNLQKSQLSKLNEATKRIFSEGSASVVSPEIPAATLDELLSSKTSRGTKPQPIRF